MRRRPWIAGGLLALAGAAWLAWPRDPAVPQDRPPAPLGTGGALDIVAFGTSLTAGNGWPRALEADLASCLRREVRVTRVALAGAGSAWGETQTGRVRDAAPDLVLIEFATNDADLKDGVSPAVSRARHLRILRQLRTDLPDARLMLMTMSPVSGILRHLQRPRLATYNAMYRDLAASGEAALADLAPRWHAARAAGLPPPPDGLHPGDRATAAVVVPALVTMIAEAAGGCAGQDG